jgi:TolA-binding protein
MILSALLLSAVLAQPATETPAPSAATTAEPAVSSSATAEIEAGLKAYKRRAYAQAEAHFQKAVDADPQSAAANYYLGYAIYKRVEKSAFHADKRRAAKYFSAAFNADPRFRPDWGGKSR